MSLFSPRTALISVSDKRDIVDLAHALAKLDWRIMASGGTHATLQNGGVEVIDVAGYTQAPEMFNGRVKTIHPKIAGGILARREQDLDEMTRHGIVGIDLVVVNLYPFEDTVADSKSSEAEIVEQIDIGGPSLARAAAKNHQDVLVLVDPNDYADFIERCEKDEIDLSYRRSMAAKAFRHTAAYDAAIAKHFSDGTFPERLTASFQKTRDLRYGENPHQQAAFYTSHPRQDGTLASVEQLQGKELSFNNLADADAALNCARLFQEPSCTIVKHGNPCGVAVRATLQEAYEAAFQCDTTSAFGGVIAFNQEIDDATIKTVVENQFVEVLVAPAVTQDAIQIARKRKNLRLLTVGDLGNDSESKMFELKPVRGGVLIQTSDSLQSELTEYEIVTERQPTEEELEDLQFSWKVAMHVKSNAIVYAKNVATIGIGAGQMNRVFSARIARMAAESAQLLTQGAVMASDAFFPFKDSIETAADAGITAVIQPGGSVRDEEVVAAANEHHMAMIFTKTRHFKH